MKSFEYTIKDELGIHARPAGLLAKEAKKYAKKAVAMVSLLVMLNSCVPPSMVKPCFIAG